MRACDSGRRTPARLSRGGAARGRRRSRLRRPRAGALRHRRQVRRRAPGRAGAGERAGMTWLRMPAREDLPAEVLDLWNVSLERLGFVPNGLRAFALRSARLLAWTAPYDEL